MSETCKCNCHRKILDQYIICIVHVAADVHSSLSYAYVFFNVRLKMGDTITSYYLAPGGGCEVLFSPGLSVCLSVCVSVCPANILVFYFSAIRRDIDLKCIQDTYMVVLNSLK